MSEQAPPESAPRSPAGVQATASVRPRRRLPLVWIVPILTALIAGWLAWDTYSKRGPTITIAFDTAAGLTAGQSQLKYRNVVMGTVKTIGVSPDLSKVIVTVETVREAKDLLTDKTIFWVVKPQLFAGSLSGLETILSGSYIGMRPAPGGNPERNFVGQQDPPVLQASAKGTTYRLETKRLGSISLGAPIFFRDIEVGAVLGWDLHDLASRVVIQAFVRAPFDQYVRDDTSFWDASGVSVKLGTDGVQVKLESLRAVLLGGIAFETSTTSTEPISKPDHFFRLFKSFDQAKAAGFGRQIELLSYFPGSVAGLSPGAEVTFRGLKIGEVSEVDLVYDPKTDKIVVPVRYRIESGRVANIAKVKGLEPEKVAEEMVTRGLRATLEAPSLLTGQKVVALEIVPDAKAAELRREGAVYVIPTAEIGGFDSITHAAAEILSKINRIDFDKIGRSLMSAATGIDDTVNGPQLKRTMAALEKAMIDVQDFAHNLDVDGAPALKRLPEIARQLQDAVTKANRLIGSVDQGYGSQSKFHRDLDRLLPQITDAARSIRALADLLARHPEALITGRTNTGKE
jgi:paraquat-inducible protein B